MRLRPGGPGGTLQPSRSRLRGRPLIVPRSEPFGVVGGRCCEYPYRVLVLVYCGVPDRVLHRHVRHQPPQGRDLGRARRCAGPRSGCRLRFLYGGAIYLFYPQNPGSTVNTATDHGDQVHRRLSDRILAVRRQPLRVHHDLLADGGPREEPAPPARSWAFCCPSSFGSCSSWWAWAWCSDSPGSSMSSGRILIWTAYKMVFTAEEDHVDPTQNILYKQASKMFPVDPDPHTPKFFTTSTERPHHDRLAGLPGDWIHGCPVRR